MLPSNLKINTCMLCITCTTIQLLMDVLRTTLFSPISLIFSIQLQEIIPYAVLKLQNELAFLILKILRRFDTFRHIDFSQLRSQIGLHFVSYNSDLTFRGGVQNHTTQICCVLVKKMV